jgi:hypothetical protein
MYKGIRHTEDILYRFQNNETRVADKSRRDKISETYKTIDDRFYNPKISTSTKMGQSLKAKIMDLANTKKHDRVRRNKVEKAKLDALEKEL